MKISVNFTDKEKENLRNFHVWLENPCKLIEGCNDMECSTCPIAALKYENLRIAEELSEVEYILKEYVEE